MRIKEEEFVLLSGPHYNQLNGWRLARVLRLGRRNRDGTSHVDSGIHTLTMVVILREQTEESVPAV